MFTPELLSPAGTLKNMRYAFAYGADAVYAGQPRYSLRVRNNEFNHENLAQGINEAHALGKKFYVVVNIAPHNAKLKTFLRDLKPVIDMGPDALIMSDPGLIMMVREAFPQMDIHLSVQANAVNWATVKFWKQMGLTRVILSRELSLEEIAEIRAEVPDMELEIFVHGALCMAYSGRCLLSGYINKRDPNQGTCTNACRWQYKAEEGKEDDTGNIVHLHEPIPVQTVEPTLGIGAPTDKVFMLSEAQKPGEYMSAFEDEHGTYIMNSKDLRAIQHVERLTQLGVHSLKIEGRTKSFYYCARTAQVYRRAIDDAVAGKPFDPMKPLSVRSDDAQKVIARLRARLAKEPGASLFLMAVQDIRVGGRQANASYQYTLLADDLAALREWEPKIRTALAALPELADVNSDQQDKGSEMDLVYDRETMARLGISVSDANNLLNNAFGQRQISTIYQPLNQYKVVMEVAPPYTQDVSSLDKMFIINNEGKAIPLSYFASWRPANAPLSVNHQGLSAASTISFNLPDGGSLSDATAAVERTMTQLGVPSTVRGAFAGTAQVFQDTLKSQLILILAAIATVYIVLGVLYESYIHPLTILSTLPSAGVGALLALELFGAPFSLIALIGIMLLIGIVKKNAIMMVDFALEAQRNGGISAREAIFQASLLRFRPIMMTTLAALFGALPLVLTRGDGAELRQPLGITIAGGLVMSQLLTLYTTPVVYLYFDRLQAKFRRNKQLAPLPH